MIEPTYQIVAVHLDDARAVVGDGVVGADGVVWPRSGEEHNARSFALARAVCESLIAVGVAAVVKRVDGRIVWPA